MIDWILGGLLVVAIFFATRYVICKTKNGECIGCPGGKQGCHCCRSQKK
ncbi:MAG: FeoB-associated Cys-rich membrane protein [Anaerotruncus sp.]|nr:FeoB-associated Cys-rich membrane protein [Anaerotruncus sp.]